MKKLRITVEGKVYDVTVELLEDDEQYLTGSTLGVPALPHAAAKSPRPATPTTAAPAAAVQSLGPGDPNSVRSPIAGTVQKVFVEAGKRVEEKTPVILLDAMKMDTYIYAPRTGEIVEVSVQPGDSVQVGQPLIRYRAES
jgi:glutaconyl-CoA/methylmalonyl-CoA decarboxylase subunit gamma